MDDLLDLNWSAPSSSNTVKQPIPTSQKPKDAFADLLSTTPKPVDVSKLSLIERQRMQQQQQASSTLSSPWLTPTQAITPVSSTTNTARSSPTSSHLKAVHNHKPLAASATSSSFEDLLNPFGSSNKKLDQDRNTPLNQL
jgi:hypothetical protein